MSLLIIINQSQTQATFQPTLWWTHSLFVAEWLLVGHFQKASHVETCERKLGKRCQICFLYLFFYIRLSNLNNKSGKVEKAINSPSANNTTKFRFCLRPGQFLCRSYMVFGSRVVLVSCVFRVHMGQLAILRSRCFVIQVFLLLVYLLNQKYLMIIFNTYKG